jgi:hypothetical protein
MMSQVLFGLLLLSAMLVAPAGAHEGHIHPPSIGRSTHPYLQACIAPYLHIQAALAEGRLDEGVKQAARELAKQARAGAEQESEATGRAMLVTSIVLSLGFFIFTFATMRNLVNFGLLTAFTIVMALVADYLVAPALMVLVNRPKAET